MFALKRAHVVRNLANKFSGFRWKSDATVLDSNIRQNQNEKYSYPRIKSLFPYMTRELESEAEYMQIFPGK